MPRTYVTDMSHFTSIDDPDVKPPAAAVRLGEYLGAITEAGTAAEAGEMVESPLRCRRRPGRQPCPGRLRYRRTEVPPQIAWACPSCGENGVIRGWEGTRWDRSRTRTRSVGVEPDARRLRVRVPEIHYRWLRDVLIMDYDAERIVLTARWTPGGVLLDGYDEDFDELLGYLAAAANHASDAREQERLDELYGFLSQSVEEAIEGASPFQAG